MPLFHLLARHGDEMDMDMAGMNMSGMSGMSGMGDADSDMGMMATMMVTFQNDIETALYVEAWTPNSVGTYAASCIFLVVLAVLLRALLAAKSIQEAKWLDQELKRRYVVVNGRQTLQENLSAEDLKQQMVLSANGVEEQVTVVQKSHQHARPWRISVDPIRAIVDTLIAAVGYFL